MMALRAQIEEHLLLFAVEPWLGTLFATRSGVSARLAEGSLASPRFVALGTLGALGRLESPVTGGTIVRNLSIIQDAAFLGTLLPIDTNALPNA